MPVVIQTNSNIGDALCAIPAINALADKKQVHLAMHCEQVRALVTHPNVAQVWDAPLGTRSNVVMGIRNVVDKHPTAVSMAQAGIKMPDDWFAMPWLKAPAPESGFSGSDVVIAPFTRDETMRGWKDDAWRELIEKLLQDGNSVTIVLGPEDRRLDFSHLPESLRQELNIAVGLPLLRLATVLGGARKAVITVDSMANRLCHAIGVSNQVLLCANCVPARWGRWPGVAWCDYDSPDRWKIHNVLEGVRRAAQVKKGLVPA